ncbi:MULTISPECIES: transaldolase [unclassified Pseudoclavibacter]|uniref:transaldolase n=1 Tax=unclassified Pseudoclavibacter TaxID=2615177 RepID=UPI0015CB6DC1|nr:MULTISPECIES: transaldolase [unclassified Pseudoclavibacter]MBS3178020.1 transaldolase [Pseudoclavibacter sp. Marseille-Q4354]NYF13723.1 transaldolase [Pseudoclavibacter sp. JAI123]
MTSTPTAALAEAGVSIWLDDLSRSSLESGALERLIAERGIVGVTTNPTIFAGALSKGDAYDTQVAELQARGASIDEAIFEITTDDVRSACDLFLPIYEATDGLDGRVSIEVSPELARDTAATIEEAKRLWATVDRKNAMIKIPATVEGLPAITEVIASGISVNVTLIFSLSRYREVVNAYLSGLEQAKERGHDLSTIRSVASFFVSRVDAEIDKRLVAAGSDEATALKSRAALANARLAYAAFEEEFSSERAKLLLAEGAHVQRPLWASTGVKDPALPDTLYVTELVAPNTVNTMPEKTLEAVADHGVITGNTVAGTAHAANTTLDELEALGVSYVEVTEQLETEGVDKFIVSWQELKATVDSQLKAAAAKA